MTRTRILTAVAAAAVGLLAALFAGVLADGPTQPAKPFAASPAVPVGDQTPVERLLQGLSTGNTADYVRQLEGAIRDNPVDGASLTLLGFAYQQRQRETGDPSYYSLAEKALRGALARGHQPLAFTGLATLSVSRHRWNDAIGFAKRALAVNPDDATALAALGDAYVNLGRYEQAFDTFDRVAVLAPSLGTYARISYGRELLGRPEAAIGALELAFELNGSTIPENEAWVRVQLGNLQFSLGRLEEAAASYSRALERYPGYVAAQAGLAKVDAARGAYESAARRLRKVVDVLPLPQHAILLGDILTAAGHPREASDAYELVDAIERLLGANGVRTELQTALFDLDRGRDLEGALERARAAYQAAPGIDAADVLAWALYKNGRCEEARGYSIEALRLGTRSGLLLFHRGMIERCLGDDADARRFLARALEVDPYFSFVYAPMARALIA